MLCPEADETFSLTFDSGFCISQSQLELVYGVSGSCLIKMDSTINYFLMEFLSLSLGYSRQANDRVRTALLCS